MNSLQGSFLIALFREDKNTMWVAQRPPPGCDGARSTGPPTSCWTLHPYMRWGWCLWADAVPRQHRTVLVCRPKWTGNPWDSLWSWQQTNVWVNHTLFISGSVSLSINRPNMQDQWRFSRSSSPRPLIVQCLSLAGIDHGGAPQPVGPTPRPDVHPLPQGTHLLFAQSGRIEHVPLDGYHMKKDDAKAVLHLPVSLVRWTFLVQSFNRHVEQILIHLRFILAAAFFWFAWKCHLNADKISDERHCMMSSSEGGNSSQGRC